MLQNLVQNIQCMMEFTLLIFLLSIASLAILVDKLRCDEILIKLQFNYDMLS